ncbi:hypothetical protein K438DRAFT_1811210 [Mycena galopus ATCC 62051]|nr:hypothetical protein K438DRAFT_1811210 [Mycena galopus ATCC 62051]
MMLAWSRGTPLAGARNRFFLFWLLYFAVSCAPCYIDGPASHPPAPILSLFSSLLSFLLPPSPVYYMLTLRRFFAPSPPRNAIHRILRLSTKCRVAPLRRRRALQHLSSAHPTSLAPWDGLCGASSASNSTSLVPAPYPGPSFDPARLEQAILTLVRAARSVPARLRRLQTGD